MRLRSTRTTAASGLAAFLVLSIAAQSGFAAQPTAANPPTAVAAFEALKGLAGTWEGAPEGDLEFRVTYRLAAGGSVVMETLFPGSDHEMISMYHLDGENLVLTHYCSMGNQPRMKLDRSKSTSEHLVFAFAGGTNFDPKRDGHIHSGTIDLGTPNVLRSSWAYYEGAAQKDTKDFDLKRKSD